MKRESSVVVIYHHRYFQSGPDGEGMYFVPLEILDEDGPIPSELVQNLLESMGMEDRQIRDFDQLKSFTMGLADKLRLFGGHLMSLEDYNKGLESIHHVEDYRQFLLRQGELVVNENYGKSNNLFKKFFQ